MEVPLLAAQVPREGEAGERLTAWRGGAWLTELSVVRLIFSDGPIERGTCYNGIG